MAAKLVRIEAPITGLFDKIINVGDQAMVVTTGYSHRVHIAKGKYLGYIDGSAGQRAQIEVKELCNVQVKPDGTEFSWAKDYSSVTWEEVKKTLTWKNIVRTRISTLYLNRIATLEE